MAGAIYIKQEDKEQLMKILEENKYTSHTVSKYIESLELEMERADVKKPDQISGNFIAMNSKVIISVNGIEEEITLVYPKDADARNNKISVLSPIGTAILGYSEGSVIEWRIPDGLAKIEIMKVTNSPS
jgi:regulator of nucleoside diphosphate kinase